MIHELRIYYWPHPERLSALLKRFEETTLPSGTGSASAKKVSGP